MDALTYAIITVLALAITAIITRTIVKLKYEKIISEKDAAIKTSEALREAEKTTAQERLNDAKNEYQHILQTTKAELALENQEQLKAREESLKKEAQETMKQITGDLDKSIKDMKEKFEAQSKSSAADSAAIKEKFDTTVNDLRRQTESIGKEAANLANTLKGKNKMQGIFGETILSNILKNEGLLEGRDFEAEFYLRDKNGNLLTHEESGKRLRPDFILHFPDNTDILLDSKVSLTALSDYFEAESDEQKSEASKRNLESVKSHIAELTGKEYQKYVQGRKTLDYVIMFIPNYGAYQLAKMEDPGIFKYAFDHSVLITTEETLIPFLRLIRSAWIQKEQMDNVHAIMDYASKMVDKVSDFCEENTKLEVKLEKMLSDFRENKKRLVEGKGSIVRNARHVVECGVPLSPGKTLPEVPED